jgi:hypothetical protein
VAGQQWPSRGPTPTPFAYNPVSISLLGILKWIFGRSRKNIVPNEDDSGSVTTEFAETLAKADEVLARADRTLAESDKFWGEQAEFDRKQAEKRAAWRLAMGLPAVTHLNNNTVSVNLRSIT